MTQKQAAIFLFIGGLFVSFLNYKKIKMKEWWDF